MPSSFNNSAKRTADFVVTSPLVSWTWSGIGEMEFAEALPEFRPADRETVREMMAGRYLLASKLVDSHGISPFAIDKVNPAWWEELQSFSWLRHFRDVQSAADQRFARTLMLDWIGRNSEVRAKSWTPALTATRVMNWLRHLPVVTKDIGPDQARSIVKSLAKQIQSLRLRGGLATDPLDRLLPAIALVGVSLCEKDGDDALLTARMRRLKAVLRAQVDEDGLHLSRNPAIQVALLTELVSVRQALGQKHAGLVGVLGTLIDAMHKALGALIMGNGELAYFNGSGQMPVDLVLRLQSQSELARTETARLSGYGVLVSDGAKVVIDAGVVPPPEFSASAHASGLAFEFTHGSDLIVGSCGPAPSDIVEDRNVFRLAAAHSGPSLGGHSTARVVAGGRNAGRLEATGPVPHIHLDSEDCGVEVTNFAFAERFGVHVRRNLTLISGGDTLVGQDTLLPSGRVQEGAITLRFHLAPGAEAVRSGHDEMIAIKLKSGAEWVFLWEGGEAEIEDSVRQSAYFGFFRTQQIVIEAEIAANRELSWIFTRQSG